MQCPDKLLRITLSNDIKSAIIGMSHTYMNKMNKIENNTIHTKLCNIIIYRVIISYKWIPC